MKAVIIDDEHRSHEVLRELLSRYHPDVEVLASGYNVKEGLELVRKHRPDLVFLDVEMPDGLGFDLLEQIGKPDFFVIFVTGYEKYAITAIKFGALDYLVKPVQAEALREAVLRAKEEELEKISREQMQLTLEAYRQLFKKELPTRLSISTSDGILYKLVKDVIRLEAQQNYTQFVLREGREKILASINIGEYEEQFEPYEGFMRVHRSHLVNLSYVEKYVKSGGRHLVMSDGTAVPVSRMYRDELEKRLEKL